MKKSIWKFPLLGIVEQDLEMPMNAEILTVQIQGEKPCLWAIVNPNADLEIRTIEVFLTGWEMDKSKRNYISTFQLENGALIFHVFEKSIIQP